MRKSEAFLNICDYLVLPKCMYYIHVLLPCRQREITPTCAMMDSINLFLNNTMILETKSSFRA